MIFSDISLSEASNFNLGVNNNINNLGIFVPPHFVSSNIKPTKMNKFSRNKEYDHSNSNNNLMNEIFLQIELQKNLGYESSNQIEMLCKKLSHEKSLSKKNIEGMIWKQVYPFHSIDEEDDGWMMIKSDDDFCKDGSNNCKHYNLHVMNLPEIDVGRTLIGYHRFDLCNFKSIPDYYHVQGKREIFIDDEKGKKKTISLRDNTVIYSDGFHCVLENPWTIKVNEDLKDQRMKGFLSSEDMIQLKHCICRRVEI
jgi:hypothetical protein